MKREREKNRIEESKITKAEEAQINKWKNAREVIYFYHLCSMLKLTGFFFLIFPLVSYAKLPLQGRHDLTVICFIAINVTQRVCVCVCVCVHVY